MEIDERSHVAHPLHMQFVEERVEEIKSQLEKHLPLFKVRWERDYHRRNPMSLIFIISYSPPPPAQEIHHRHPFSLRAPEEVVLRVARNTAMVFGEQLFFREVKEYE